MYYTKEQIRELHDRFNREVYVVLFSQHDRPYIEKIKYKDLVRSYAEETTTPYGVAPMMFIADRTLYGTRSFEIRKWVAGQSIMTDVCETKEEAEIQLLECWEKDMNNHPYPPVYSDSRTQAVQEYADCQEISYRTALRRISSFRKEGEKAAEDYVLHVMKEWRRLRAIEDNGQPCPNKLKAANRKHEWLDTSHSYDNVSFPCCYPQDFINEVTEYFRKKEQNK